MRITHYLGLICLLLLLVNCSKDEGATIEGSKLIGTWNSFNTQGEVNNVSITFSSGDKCDIYYYTLLEKKGGKNYYKGHSLSGSYTVKGSHIHFENYSSSFTLDAECKKLTDDEMWLTVTSDSGNYRFTFRKD